MVGGQFDNGTSPNEENIKDICMSSQAFTSLITDGPLYTEFFTSLMRRGSSPARFRASGKDVDINVSEIVREDGSRNSWLFTGVPVSGSIPNNWKTVKGFYRSNEHSGNIQEARTEESRIPQPHGNTWVINDGPGFEELFRSLIEGERHRRETVWFTLHEPLEQYKKWHVVINGIRAVPSDKDKWAFMAYPKKSEGDTQLSVNAALVGYYVTTTRKGYVWLEYTD